MSECHNTFPFAYQWNVVFRRHSGRVANCLLLLVILVTEVCCIISAHNHSEDLGCPKYGPHDAIGVAVATTANGATTIGKILVTGKWLFGYSLVS